MINNDFLSAFVPEFPNIEDYDKGWTRISNREILGIRKLYNILSGENKVEIFLDQLPKREREASYFRQAVAKIH